MATSTVNTNKPILPRGADVRPIDSYNRAELYSGKALDFDGVNDYVDLDGFTMAGDVATIVFQAKFSNGNYMLDINTQRFVLLNDTTNGLSIYNSNAWAYYGETIRDEIGFYAIVSDGTTQRAYYNGHQLGEDKTIVAINWDSITEMALGSNNNGTGNFFDGQIAGFKIFNTALTAAQIADLYNNPEKIVPTGVDNTALKLWLPMMEGAGTTAYDGSGNGNHGTISGATYVNGVGAPVAQTSVIDWNKGTNYLPYSEELDEWTSQTLTISQSAATAPDGSTNAYDLNDTNSGTYGILLPSSNLAMAGDFVGSVFIKKTTGSLSHYPGLDIGQVGSYLIIDTTNGTAVDTGSNYSDITITSYNDDWWRVSAKATINATKRPIRFWPALSDNGTSISVSATGINTFWGAQVEQASSVGPYVRTGATTQPTPVLLPQGLTTGRDITGVNLFENVRKQGALNLDGSSYAEVHDNGSLDFGTGSFTLEAWVKGKFVFQGSVFNMVISLGGNITSSNNAGLMFLNNTVPYFIYSNPGALTGSPKTEGDWIHMVGTYDQTNTRFYVNGVQTGQSARTATNITNEFVKVIGRDGTDPNRYYNDQIAQPRIYNRALTAEEVLKNYNATSSLYI